MKKCKTQLKKEQSRKWQIRQKQEQWQRISGRANNHLLYPYHILAVFQEILQECDSDIKDAIKIRLHMWQVNCNQKRDNTDTKCPLCQKSEDTTEHVLEYEKAKKFTLSKENSQGEWEEITEIYRKNKKKRELAIIKAQDQHKIIKESGKKSKIRKKTERKKQKNKQKRQTKN